MGRLITFANLREEVRQRYDLGTFSSSAWETTTAVNAAINASLQAFYALLLDCGWDDYFETTSDLTTTASVDVTSLPTRCYRVHNLTWLRGIDDPVPLDPADTRDARLSGLTARSWDSYKPRYRLHGSAIRWLPTPSAVYTVRCTYAALPADLSADGDSFDAGPGWEEWVVNDVCLKLAQREERDISSFASMRRDAEERVRSQAPLRGDTSGNLFLDQRAVPIDGTEWELRNWLARRVL